MLIDTTAPLAWLGFFVLAAAAVLTPILTLLLQPLLARYAVARPNARSSHAEPTPQGAGIAVIGAMVVVAIISYSVRARWPYPEAVDLMALVAGAVLLVIVGIIDDIWTLSPAVRIFEQIIAAGTVILLLPAHVQIFAELPQWLERCLMLVGYLWLINLVNFMDGIDWITVGEVIAIMGGLIIIGAVDDFPPLGLLTACALFGATIGFAPFNRPVAKLFLGDAGSTPIGLIIGWLLILLASEGHLAASLLLPLYYIADATVTLMRRVINGERFWQAHRTHFYQQARAKGLSVMDIVSRVFAMNIALILLALMTVIWPSPLMDIFALAIGCIGVAGLLIQFRYK